MNGIRCNLIPVLLNFVVALNFLFSIVLLPLFDQLLPIALIEREKYNLIIFKDCQIYLGTRQDKTDINFAWPRFQAHNLTFFGSSLASNSTTVSLPPRLIVEAVDGVRRAARGVSHRYKVEELQSLPPLLLLLLSNLNIIKLVLVFQNAIKTLIMGTNNCCKASQTIKLSCLSINTILTVDYKK